MDFITIFSALLRWGLPALAGGAAALLLLAGAYRVYKKVFHGRGTVRKGQAVCGGLLCCWLLLVVGLTSLSRGANFTGAFNPDLFSGYVSAWNNWSLSELQLILFNMLMFAPLGFLLPLLWKRAERLPVTLAVSLGVTGFIELFQLATGTGIFELDDLLHNLLGSLAGYFLVMALLSLAREKRLRFAPAAKALLIPGAVGLAVGAAFLAYARQPYGNMSILPAAPQDMTGVRLEADWQAEERGTAAVYKSRHALDKAWTETVRAGLEQLEGMTFSGPARREDENLGYMGTDAKGRQARLLFFFRTGEWSCTTFAEPAPLTGQAAASLRERHEGWMKETGLLPPDAAFTLQNGDTLRWDAAPAGDLAEGVDAFQQGSVMIQFDASGALASFFYQITWNERAANQPILSPEEAWAQVQAGNFEQYVPFVPGDVVHVTGCELRYLYDTKGFYQPVYAFSGYLNDPGNLWTCSIPALKS